MTLLIFGADWAIRKSVVKISVISFPSFAKNSIKMTKTSVLCDERIKFRHEVCQYSNINLHTISKCLGVWDLCWCWFNCFIICNFLSKQNWRTLSIYCELAIIKTCKNQKSHRFCGVLLSLLLFPFLSNVFLHVIIFRFSSSFVIKITHPIDYP